MTDQANKNKFEIKQKSFLIIAFYHFVSLENVGLWQAKIKKICSDNSLLGTILIAPEGINGAIAGDHIGINDFVNWLHEQTEFEKIEIK